MSVRENEFQGEPDSEEACSQAKKIKLEEDQTEAHDGKLNGQGGCETPTESNVDEPNDTASEKLRDNSSQEVCTKDLVKDTKEETPVADAKESEALPDPLSYTRDSKEFTSEIFKVQIHNLPQFGFSELKKRLKTHLGLNPHKIKSPSRSVAYVCFRNAEDRDKALGKINGHVWKGYTLDAKTAAPVADPYLRKKQENQEKGDSGDTDKSGAETTKELTAEEAEQRLRGNVCPLWNVEYSQQLEQKTERIKTTLRRVISDNFVKYMFRNIKVQYEGLPCPLLPIIPSPEISEYRNKNEFTIGYALDGKTVMVGFRFGMYKDGTTSVGDCSNLHVAMPAALPIVKSFTEFVPASRWTPYLQQTGTGHWQTLTVRTLRTGDVMVMVDFVPRDLPQAEQEEARLSVKDFFTSGPGSNVNITSCYFRVMGKRGSNNSTDVHLLFGEKHVYESLMGLKFRISPEAFFQVNTPATEKLYSLIHEWCEATPDTTVLDVCCGTGTIGLAIAKRVKKVIGIELCTQAVEDARANAELNGVTNATYHCSKVEDVINSVVVSVQSLDGSNDVVAILDPPRAGIHKNVIRALRQCKSIRRLVYVSCNPDGACTNFIDLIRPETGRHRGDGFTLVKAVPVDLFPGTRHCELVLMLDRAQPAASSHAQLSEEPKEETKDHQKGSSHAQLSEETKEGTNDDQKGLPVEGSENK